MQHGFNLVSRVAANITISSNRCFKTLISIVLFFNVFLTQTADFILEGVLVLRSTGDFWWTKGQILTPGDTFLSRVPSSGVSIGNSRGMC